MPEATVVDYLPVLTARMSNVIQKMVQIPTLVISRANQSERKPLNDKGYRFYALMGFNAAHGYGQRGMTMIAGGHDRYIEFCVGSAVSNMARAWDGGAVTHQGDPTYKGLSEAEQMTMDAKVHAMEHEKNFCYGGVLCSRGVVSSISYDSGTDISTVTFDSTEGGSYYLKGTESGAADKVNMRYFFHHPTTFAEHGDNTDSPFPLIDVPSRTTARFKGDVSGGTTVAANDLIVPEGALNTTSINRGIRNLEYMTPVTGDYFTANVDAEPLLQAIQHNADGDPVDRAMLEYMDTLYSFKWPEDEAGTANHVDFISKTQSAKMLFQADGLWRLEGKDYREFDPKNKFVGWGRREWVPGVYIQDSNWFTTLTSKLYHYEQVPFDVWKLDGLDKRTIPDSGSIRDAVQRHYLGVDQYGHEWPGKNMLIYGAATSGAATKTDS